MENSNSQPRKNAPCVRTAITVSISTGILLSLTMASVYYYNVNQLLQSEISSYNIKKIPRKEIVQKLERRKKFSQISDEFLETSPEKLISIKTLPDLIKKKKQLNLLIWGNENLPTKALPTSVIANDISLLSGPAYTPILARCDKLLIEMEYGITSNIYLLFPIKSNQRFILFHQGHEDDINSLEKGIRFFLKRGYTVGVAFMPTNGPNSRPLVLSPDFGPIHVKNHQAMSLLKPKTGHPIKFFLYPVIVTMNYVQNNYQFRLHAMTGLSGGGWTTVMAAALDDRIDASFPVAGANPMFLKADECLGDFEQSTFDFYKHVDYLDIFVMGAYGHHRIQLRIYNKYDSCCFFGVKSQLIQPSLDTTIKNLGSGRSLLLINDESFIHTFDYRSIRTIFATLDKGVYTR